MEESSHPYLTGVPAPVSAVSSLVMVRLVGLTMRRPGGSGPPARWMGPRAKLMYSGGVGSICDGCGEWPTCGPPVALGRIAELSGCCSVE